MVVNSSRRRLLRALGPGLRPSSGPSRVPTLVGECCNQQVCVAVCGAQALRAYELGSRAGVALSHAACSGCGRCVEHCPSRALAMREPEGVPGDRCTPMTVHEPVMCSQCDEPFVTAGEDVLCLSCRKSNNLFTSGLLAVVRRAGPAAREE
jgi:Pyruvate/2-oxoacid:ferredoxin oxidoreductase delta subunit